MVPLRALWWYCFKKSSKMTEQGDWWITACFMAYRGFLRGSQMGSWWVPNGFVSGSFLMGFLMTLLALRSTFEALNALARRRMAPIEDAYMKHTCSHSHLCNHAHDWALFSEPEEMKLSFFWSFRPRIFGLLDSVSCFWKKVYVKWRRMMSIGCWAKLRQKIRILEAATDLAHQFRFAWS